MKKNNTLKQYRKEGGMKKNNTLKLQKGGRDEK